MVIGPPGTGKTYALQGWLEKQAGIYGAEKVLACSYTKTAAREIASRVKGVPKENVGTLHSICFRALGNPKLTVSKIKEFNEANPDSVVSTWSNDVDDPYGEHSIIEKRGDNLLAQMDVLRAQMRPRFLWPPHVAMFARKWEDWKDQCGYLDFTDLLEKCLTDLDTAPFDPAVCAVDEAQDCSKLQIDLLLKWGSKLEKLVLVGDSDQCLYDWCGADPFTFLDLNLPDDHTTVLPKSSRVPRAVHSLAEAWIKLLSRRRERVYHPRDFDGAVETTHATIKWPYPAIDLAGRLLENGKTVMLLTAYNQALEKIKHVLRERGIPFHNPYRTKRGDWNPLMPGTRKIVRPVDRVLALLALDGRTFEEPKEVWSWHDLWSWADPLAADGIFRRGAKEWLKEKKSNHDQLNTQELQDWLDPKGIDWLDGLAFGTKEQTQASLEHWLERTLPERRKVLDYPTKIAIKRGGAALLDEPRLTIGTVHSVKGGQADTVILWPDVSRSAMRGWMTGGLLADAVRRTFYVGITRARETLVIGQQASPLAVSIAA